MNELTRLSFIYCRITEEIKSKHKETEEGPTERFKFCEGVILSENNYPEVLKEFKALLLQLYHLNAISIHALRKISHFVLSSFYYR